MLFIIIIFNIVIIKHDKIKKIWLVIFSIVLIITAAFRGEGVDQDYQMYEFIYNHVDNIKLVTTEPTYMFFCQLFRNFFQFDSVSIFILYAILGVSIKMYSINKISNFVFLSLLIYFSNLYILHDMTQIRASIGSSILLLMIKPITEGNKKQFFVLFFIAFLFHYSSMISLVLLLLNPNKINKKVWFLVIPAAYFLYFINFSGVNFYKFIPIEAVSSKVNTYVLTQDANEEEKVNVFSVLLIIKFCIISLFLYKIDDLFEKNKYAILLLKLYILSFFVLIFFADVITLSLRFSEFLNVVEIVTLPLIVFCFPNKIRLLPKAFVIVYCLFLFYLHIRAETLLIF